eukprot:Lithocolla_globosa_v1_NODE_3368_length_1689_cov_3.545900.p1 type:complete len:269 gc:universal NODE_3368_length_1689_cov_3.545900:1128-322(-)
MNPIITKQLIYIDSVNRISGTHTDFTYKIELPQEEYNKVVVLDCTIPKSYYTVNSRNITMVVEENSIQRTITIPVGNYSRKSFRNVLQTQLNTNPGSGYSYTVSFDSSSLSGDTGKYTYTVVTSNPQPIFIFTTGLTDVIGFDPNSSYTFSADTLVSQNVINFRPKITLYLRSNMCQSAINNNILQNILSTEADFDYIRFQNQAVSEYAKDFSKVQSNIYSFTLVDEDNVIVDLNGLNIVLTLLIYKQDNKFQNMIKGYIKYKLLNEK